METNRQDPATILANALARHRDGLDPALIELPESAIFPHLIPVQPFTARKARCTGTLLGRPGPRFVRRGRSISYRLSDLLEYLADGESYTSTAEAGLASKEATDA